MTDTEKILFGDGEEEDWVGKARPDSTGMRKLTESQLLQQKKDLEALAKVRWLVES